MMIPNRQKFATRLEQEEGREKRTTSGRYVPYRDSRGILTIGVGRNLEQRGLSDLEVDFLLQNDIDDAYKESLRAFPWMSQMSDVRQRVLMDMVFNMGVAGVQTFKQTLAAMEHGDYWLASVGMLHSLWATQVGKRAQQLARMMETGEDDADGEATSAYMK